MCYPKHEIQKYSPYVLYKKSKPDAGFKQMTYNERKMLVFVSLNSFSRTIEPKFKILKMNWNCNLCFPSLVGVSTGAIAGIVIAVVLIICVTGLLVFFLYSSKNKAPMKTPEIPTSTGFENVAYNEKDGTKLSAFETNA